MPEQQRTPNVITVSLTTSLSTTPAIPCHDYAGMHIACPASFASTTITVYCSDSQSGTFRQLVDTDGADVALTVEASKVFDFPVALFAAHWVKLVTDADDSSRAVTLMQKS